MTRNRNNPSGQYEGNDNRQANTFRNPLYWDVNSSAPIRDFQPINSIGIPYGQKIADPKVIDPITKRFLSTKSQSKSITK